MLEREPTAFENRVYDATRMIPRGRVSTYAVIGRIIGCRSAQAIGQAVSRCPSSEVPCHRVIRSDLTLGGYGNELDGPEVTRKTRLLAAEGVRFKEGNLEDPACFWSGQ